MRFIVISLGAVALAAVVSSLIALRAVGDRSDQIDRLTDDLESLRNERDGLTTEVELADAASAVIESRWLAAVAVGGDHAPAQSRLLAVEAATRSPTPESAAALGHLLFADARTDPPIVELEHDGPVWATDTASTADVVATGSDDATVKLWSTSGDLLATLAHNGEVRTLDFSADDQLIATGSAEGTVAGWTPAGEAIVSVQHADQINDVVISDDGVLMISAGHDRSTLVTEIETGEIRHELRHPDIVWAIALSNDEMRIITGGQDGMARIWDLDTGAEIVAYDLGQPVTTVEFSPDGRWLFAGGQGGTAILVDADSADGGDVGPPLEGSFRGGVIGTDWHPAGTELAVVSLGGINRYDLPARTLIAEHRVAGGARGVAYGPDGSWFATGSGDFQFNFGEITFWDTSSGTELADLNLGGPVESVSVHSTGAVLAGFRTTENLVEVGGAWLVPGPDHWIILACEGTDGTISEQTWSQLTGEAASHETGCPPAAR